MPKPPPFPLTRAARRAMAAKQRKAKGKPQPMAEQQALGALYDAAVTGIVLDGDSVDHPVEDGKVAFSIEYEDASLRWNASWPEIEDFLTMAKHALDGDSRPGDRRAIARSTIIALMDRDRHLQAREGTAVAGLVTWLALTSDAGATLRTLPTTHIGYLVTRRGEDDWNFRLIAG